MLVEVSIMYFYPKCCVREKNLCCLSTKYFTICFLVCVSNKDVPLKRDNNCLFLCILFNDEMKILSFINEVLKIVIVTISHVRAILQKSF